MKKATIYDIAAKAGVSVTTVTRAFKKDGVIKPETRERILQLAEQYGYKPSTVAVRLSQKTITIGVIVVNCSSVLTEEMRLGFCAAYRELVDYKVELLFRTFPKEEAGERCVAVLEDLLASGIEGLLISLEEYPDELVTRINRLVRRGLAVVTLVNTCASIHQVFSVYNQPYLIGRTAAELLHVFTGSHPVAVFLGNESIPIHRDALKGFCQEAERLGLPVAGVYDYQENPDRSRAITREAVERFPELRGLFISSANSIPIIEELIRLERIGQVQVIASDLYPDIARHLETGAIQATIFKNLYQQAKSAFEALYYYISGAVDRPEDIFAIPQIVIKGNLEAYQRECVLFSRSAGQSES